MFVIRNQIEVFYVLVTLHCCFTCSKPMQEEKNRKNLFKKWNIKNRFIFIESILFIDNVIHGQMILNVCIAVPIGRVC